MSADAPVRRADPPVLGAEGLAVGYRTRRRRTVLLDTLDVRLEAGALTCLLGPNGSGKSTLLRVLTGLQEPLAGTVRLAGRPLDALSPARRAREIAVVLTDPADVALLRVVDLVALGRYPHTGWTGRLGPEDHDVVRWALDVTGSAPLARRQVSELSDGERQRAFVARALAQRPRVLALDEPVAYVDAVRRVELTQLLRRVAREVGLAVLLTTHDLELAVGAADRLWLLEPHAPGRSASGPGRLHVGVPEDLVLSGTLARAFASDEVTFDLARGVFRPRERPREPVRLLGDGPAALWTARALEREGLACVTAGGSPTGTSWPNGGEMPDTRLRVAVDTLGGRTRWRLSGESATSGHGAVASEHDSIESLLAALRVRVREPRDEPSESVAAKVTGR